MQRIFSILISICLLQNGSADPLDTAKVLGSQTCMTSGCHGGAGLDRGAYHIWKDYDPHSNSAATLTNGRSKVMATQLGIENAAESKSCTICHSPMSGLPDSSLTKPPAGHNLDSGVSCASCHGPAENWLLSHTRKDFPKDALAQLGMRPLASAYQRANNCVACHQNLSDELVNAKHPPLTFELDGLLVAEPKHWREEEGFSGAKTWLVGQAVALRETAAQAKREPGDRRTAEIEAIRALLKITATGWDDSGTDLVRSADDFAKRISGAPMSHDQSRAIFSKLVANRIPFQPDTYSKVAPDFRLRAVGYYAERLALAMDRLNQSQIANGKPKMVGKEALDELFDAAEPPESFDAAIAENFVGKLDRVAKSFLETESGR
jgi:hypothetical protein